MYNVIKIIQVFKLEVKDIQLDKNLKEELELVLVISYQNNNKTEYFDVNVNTDKAKINQNNLA